MTAPAYVTFRIDDETKKELMLAAKKEERTLSFYCARILRQYVAKAIREKA